jgi:hypothetical protein
MPRSLTLFLTLATSAAALLADPGHALPKPAAQPDEADTPAIQLTADEVVVTGFPEGSEVLLASVSVTIENAILSRIWYQGLEPTVGGEALFRPTYGVPERSIWIATGVGVESGTIVAASPPGFELRETPRPWGSVHPGGGDESDYLLDSSGGLAVWIVRKSPQGAFYILAGDGARNDLDQTPNGVIVLPIDRFQPVAEDGPPLTPARPLPDDLLLVMDRRSLEYYTAQVRELMRNEEVAP